MFGMFLLPIHKVFADYFDVVAAFFGDFPADGMNFFDENVAYDSSFLSRRGESALRLTHSTFFPSP
jgi:hypothetical protein